MTKLELIGAMLGAVLIGAGFIFLGVSELNTGASIGYISLGVCIIASVVIILTE